MQRKDKTAAKVKTRGNREIKDKNWTPLYFKWPPVFEVDTPRSYEEAPVELKQPSDNINHPPHYTNHPSGIECIQITEHMNFCCGNAIKYIWRAGLKSTSPLEDLRKAKWYITREIERLEKVRLR